MSKKYLFILFQILPFLSNGQAERHIKSLFDDTDTEKRRINFITFSKSEADYWYGLYFKQAEFLDTSSNRTIEDLKRSIHFIDLNKDKLPDVVDESNDGSSPVLIYLNCKDSFKLIVDENQAKLKEVNFKENETEIIIEIQEMVMPITGEARYILKKNATHLVKRLFKRDCTRHLGDFYDTSLNIKTILTDTPLREYAGIGAGRCFIDNGEGEEYNHKSNILMRLPKNSKGWAWGEKENTLGETWLLVEFLENETDKDYQIGWINAKNVEIIR